MHPEAPVPGCWGCYEGAVLKFFPASTLVGSLSGSWMSVLLVFRRHLSGQRAERLKKNHAGKEPFWSGKLTDNESATIVKEDMIFLICTKPFSSPLDLS